MSKPVLLTNEEIEDNLKEFPLWNRQDNNIIREITASNFAAAVGIVNAIAVLAEVMDHHPDILIYGWNKIRLTLSTHSLSGLTDRDFDLAKKIDELNF